MQRRDLIKTAFAMCVASSVPLDRAFPHSKGSDEPTDRDYMVALLSKIAAPKWLKRTQRYCEHLERMVSPEGTYPPIGRSLTYRTAVFQPLGLLAWRKSLPETLPEGQVRAVMTAAQKRIFADPSNFDSAGFLTLGFAGHQPDLADVYSDNGSMYLVSESFIALGLDAKDTYWVCAPVDWTTKRAFENKPFSRDHFVDY